MSDVKQIKLLLIFTLAVAAIILLLVFVAAPYVHEHQAAHRALSDCLRTAYACEDGS